MGARTARLRRAVHVARVARRGSLFRTLREIGVVGSRPATREGARAFRQALEELGTTYIKLGQLLSSRPDLLPDVYVDELERLVDEVPPVAFDEIEAVIREDFDHDLFSRIDPAPLATASIAQIHRALLANGREVAVKVRRPGIVEQVEQDLDLLRATARMLDRHSEAAQLVQVEALGRARGTPARGAESRGGGVQRRADREARRRQSEPRRPAGDPPVRDGARAGPRADGGR